uniref:Uncharacterized protein n=1 Tax=Rhizophora mucronata TaxID=61149 RepID=A0A2P2JAG3_RHIMU
MMFLNGFVFVMNQKNHYTPTETVMDHPQVKNASAQENSALHTDVQNPMEPDPSTAAMYRPVTPAAHFNVQAESNMFTAAERSSMPTQTLQESLSDAENLVYQMESHPWQGQSCATDCAAPNVTLSGQEDPMGESGSSNFSSAHSQGVLNTLTKALQSSGVDLAQTSISVQINVSKRVNSGTTCTTSSSKAQENQYVNSGAMEQTGVGRSVEATGQAQKRPRTQKI